MREPLLSVENLEIVRRRSDGVDTIVSGIEFELAEGESIAIVGESGSGKSMTARAVMGLLPPGLEASGQVRLEGSDLLSLSQREWRRVRGTEIGLVLQDPFTMLNPILRCGDIVGESLLGGRRSRRGRRPEIARRLQEVGISAEVAAGRYPFQLSGGMRQRVAIAAALARDPRVLIADEPSTALDVTTQKEILNLMKQVQLSRGMSLILISHDLRVAFTMAERVYVFYAGKLVEVGSPSGLDAEPLHPYTHGLLLSELPSERRVENLVSIPGAVPTPDEVAGECPFAPRCRWAQDSCRQGEPPLVEVAPGRFSACIRLPEIRSELSAPVAAASTARAGAGEERGSRLQPVIVVDEVTKRFGQGERVVTAVDGVSLEVGENESVGLVGESGSGKTTIARMLVGLEQLTAGRIVIGDVPIRDWRKLSGQELRRVRSTVQVVFQDPYSSLNPARTIGWTLAEAVTTGSPGTKNVEAEVARLLASVGLPSAYAHRRPVALSGGMRQRVAIARALAVKPRVLICDEPTSALDVSVQAQILNLFKELREERQLSYLFITHDLSIVRQITDRVYVMYRGEIVESGATDSVLDLPQHAYTARLLSSVPSTDRTWLEQGASGDGVLELSTEV